MKLRLALLAVVCSFQLAAQDCLEDWTYYREVEIMNPNGIDLTDYQVRLDVNTGALVTEGKLNADGSDLRFTLEDCTLLPYFMDSLATSADNRIWVKVPELLAGNSLTIRVYYGNPDAEAYASGDDTFVFFDDFSSGEVDPAKWEPVGSYATMEVIDGVLNYASDGMNPGPRFKFVRTAMSFSDPMIFEFAAEVTNSNGFGFSSADEAITRIMFRQSVFGFDTLNQVALMTDTFDNGYQVEGLYPLIRWPRFEMQDGAIVAGINSDTLLEHNFFGNSSINSVSSETYILEEVQMTGFHFIVSSFLSAQTVYLDYLRVRKPAPMMPGSSIGEEMMNPMPTGLVQILPEGSIRIYPNPASDVIYLLSDVEETADVLLINSLGQSQLLEQIVLNQGEAIELQGIPSGFYQLVFRRHSDKSFLYSTSVVIE